MKKIKYLPKVFTALSFIVLLAVFFLLFSGRRSEAVRMAWLTDFFPGFYHHVSNLCISYTIYATAGYFWLLMGIKFKSIVGLGMIIILANFVYELFIPVLNDRDIVDAYLGTGGTMVGFIFLLLTHKYGLKANPLFESQAKKQSAP